MQKVRLHKYGETIQGQKLYEEIQYYIPFPTLLKNVGLRLENLFSNKVLNWVLLFP